MSDTASYLTFGSNDTGRAIVLWRSSSDSSPRLSLVVQEKRPGAQPLGHSGLSGGVGHRRGAEGELLPTEQVISQLRAASIWQRISTFGFLSPKPSMALCVLLSRNSGTICTRLAEAKPQCYKWDRSCPLWLKAMGSMEQALGSSGGLLSAPRTPVLRRHRHE